MKATLFVLTLIGITMAIIVCIPFLLNDIYDLSGFMLSLTVIICYVLGMTFFISVGNSKWANYLLEKLENHES